MIRNNKIINNPSLKSFINSPKKHQLQHPKLKFKYSQIYSSSYNVLTQATVNFSKNKQELKQSIIKYFQEIIYNKCQFRFQSFLEICLLAINSRNLKALFNIFFYFHKLAVIFQQNIFAYQFINSAKIICENAQSTLYWKKKNIQCIIQIANLFKNQKEWELRLHTLKAALEWAWFFNLKQYQLKLYQLIGDLKNAHAYHYLACKGISQHQKKDDEKEKDFFTAINNLNKQWKKINKGNSELNLPLSHYFWQDFQLNELDINNLNIYLNIADIDSYKTKLHEEKNHYLEEFIDKYKLNKQQNNQKLVEPKFWGKKNQTINDNYINHLGCIKRRGREKRFRKCSNQKVFFSKLQNSPQSLQNIMRKIKNQIRRNNYSANISNRIFIRHIESRNQRSHKQIIKKINHILLQLLSKLDYSIKQETFMNKQIQLKFK